MTEAERSWVARWVKGDVSGLDVEEALGVQLTEVSHRWLVESQVSQDPEAMEWALHVGHAFGFDPASLPVLQRLAFEGWHEQHEAIVNALEELRDVNSVALLCRLAESDFGYRTWDDSRSLQVRCVYSLTKIGSADAVQALQSLLRGRFEEVRQTAAQELRWLRLHGRSAELRAQAERALE